MSATNGMPYLDQEAMTNLDHTIEPGAEDLLRQSEGWADYPGWNFHGRVWFDRPSNRFACEVWRYGVPFEVLYAETLRDLMSEVCSKYGSE